jgi:hypothetical protein
MLTQQIEENKRRKEEETKREDDLELKMEEKIRRDMGNGYLPAHSSPKAATGATAAIAAMAVNSVPPWLADASPSHAALTRQRASANADYLSQLRQQQHDDAARKQAEKYQDMKNSQSNFSPPLPPAVFFPLSPTQFNLKTAGENSGFMSMESRDARPAYVTPKKSSPTTQLISPVRQSVDQNLERVCVFVIEALHPTLSAFYPKFPWYCKFLESLKLGNMVCC